MKRTLQYKVCDHTVERSVNYIPVRYILAAIITLLEITAIIGIVFALCRHIPYFYLAAWATEIACVIRIIASDDNPDYKVPWLLCVLILPVAGFMLYFLFYSRTLKKKFLRRLAELRSDSYTLDDSAAMEALRQADPQAHSQARMLCRMADTHLFTNTRSEYFPLGEDMYRRLLEDLRGARNFIFMEYFILEEGLFWNSILDILKEKAAQGLDVRVLYDDIGCMSTLPGNYSRTLHSFGIRATSFSRLKGAADSEFNNRSHRKITVIDGRIGYTGGVNIADEYINAVKRFGHWKDTALRLEGPAVWELTRLFLTDYGLNVKALPPAPESLFPVREPPETDGWVIPFGDGPRPLYPRRVGKSVIQSLLAGATRYVWMTSPYLIIDNDLCLSMENAALRGVDVRILVPGIPDKKLIFGMTRSFYKRLMDAGVKIYEYTPGFLHAKSYLADDSTAMIGTINLDYRSLVHHFENGVWLHGSECLAALRADLEQTISLSTPVKREDLKTDLFRRFVRSVVRIFAPLL